MKSGGRRVIRILSVMVLATGLCGCFGFSGCSHTKVVSNESAEEKKKEERVITVVNATDLVINSITITVGEGTEVYTIEEPDDASISVILDSAWDDYSDFTVTFMDVYDLMYVKKVSNVPVAGKVEARITQDDYVEREGDWYRLLNKKANGD